MVLFALAVSGSAAVPRRASAQYEHQPKTAPATPSCRDAGVVCLTDSTRHLFDECCMRSSQAWWMVVASKGDSLELFARGDRPASLSLSWLYHKTWQERDERGGTASFLRFRVPTTGAFELDVDLDLDNMVPAPEHETGLPYDLIARRVGRPLAVSSAPLLNLVGSGKTQYEVRPHGVVPADTLIARTYRVFSPDFDSLEICRLPCTRRQTVSVRTNRAITIGR